MDLLGLAVVDRHLPTLVPCDLLAVRPGLGAAVTRLEDLAGEGVGHLGALGWLGFMIPQLLFVGASHVGHNELDILLY